MANGFTQTSSPFPRMNPQTGQIEMIDPVTNQAIPNYNIVPSWQQIKLEDYGLGLSQEPQDSSITPPSPVDVVKQNREQEELDKRLPRLEGGNNTGFSGDYHRDPSNNFGYFDKPTGMGLISNLPGALGIAGKGINAVVNANNVGAIDAARGMMGIGGLSTKDVLSGIAKDKQGFVANVDITNQAGKTNPYSVSLEAMTPSGKTALTPDEARKRSAANPANITLSANQKENKPGIFSSIKNTAKNIFDSLFSDDTQKVESKAFGTMTVAAPKSGGKYDQFPDAPSQPTQSTSRASNHSVERERDTSLSGRGGLSDAARDAVDRGTGGLY